MIRYRRSPYRKRCEPKFCEIRNQNLSPLGRLQNQLSFLVARKLEYSRSGGSMVTRLKLKGIDGMTPPGVECAA